VNSGLTYWSQYSFFCNILWETLCRKVSILRTRT